MPTFIPSVKAPANSTHMPIPQPSEFSRQPVSSGAATEAAVNKNARATFADNRPVAVAQRAIQAMANQHTQGTKPVIQRAALAGVEMTFGNDTIANVSPDEDLKSFKGPQLQTEKNARAAMVKGMDDWEGNIQPDDILFNGREEKKHEEDSDSEEESNLGNRVKDPRFKLGRLKKVPYSKAKFADRAKKKSEGLPMPRTFLYSWRDSKGEGGWWWNMDIDPGVVEVQALPATSAQMGDNTPTGEIIDRHIFNAASKAGIKPRSHGGGHINIDFKTGFKGDFNLVLKTFLLANFSTDFKAMQPKTTEGSRDLNSPTLANANRYDATAWLTTWRRARFDKLAVLLDEGLKKKQTRHTMPGLLRDLAGWFRDNRTSGQSAKTMNVVDDKGKKVKNPDPGHALHYQAINLEHLDPKINDESTQAMRVEFRAIDPQTNRAKLLSDLKTLENLIANADKLKDADIKTMLTQLGQQYSHWSPPAMTDPTKKN